MITLNNPPGPAAVTAVADKILPEVTLLGVTGTMIPADIATYATADASAIDHAFGTFAFTIGGDLVVDSATHPSRFGTLSVNLVGAAPQTITVTGDCTGGVAGDPTAPWSLTVTEVGVGGSTTILASNTGLGALNLEKAAAGSGTLTADISDNPFSDADLQAFVGTLFTAIHLVSVVDMTDMEFALTAASWEYILQLVSAHAQSAITTDPHSITVAGAAADAAGVSGSYLWTTASDKFVHNTTSDLTIYYSGGKYKIFDDAAEQFRCASLISSSAWKTPLDADAAVTTELVGPL